MRRNINKLKGFYQFYLSKTKKILKKILTGKDTPDNKRKWTDLKASILKKYKGHYECYYCGRTDLKKGNGKRHTKNTLTFDHLVPISKGGNKYDRNNIVMACYKCNNCKGDMSIEEFKQTKYYKKLLQNNIEL